MPRPRMVLTALLGCLLVPAGLASEAALGSPDFYPSPDRPIGWRGDGTGSYPGATPVAAFHDGPMTMTKLPRRERWGPPKKKRPLPIPEDGPSKNIVWATPMPGWAHTQPIIVGDKAITMAEPHTMLCVDMHSGEILWQADNNPWEIAGVDAKEAALIQDYVDRAYAARAPINGILGNYCRLPGKWKPDMAEPLTKALELSELAYRRLVEEHPYGKRAADAFAAYQAAKEETLAGIKAGTFQKGTPKKLRSSIYAATDWIVDEYKIPTLYNWDGWIGWTFATPISDGERVYCSLGQGQVAAYDLDGKRQWAVRVPNLDQGKPMAKGSRRNPRVKAKHVPSPLLADGVLVAQAPDQMVGIDVANGRLLWRDPGVKAGGYNVSTGAIVVLADGRKVVVTPHKAILDLKTGKRLGHMPFSTYGAEGAGASIIPQGDTVVMIVSPAKRQAALGAYRLSPDGAGVAVTELWRDDKLRQTGHTPVLHEGLIYTFRDDNVVALDSGDLVARPRHYRSGMAVGSSSPIIAGKVAFSYDTGGSRKKRVDGLNIFAVTTSTVQDNGLLSGAKTDNWIDETTPPPHPALKKHLPELYAWAEERQPMTWAEKEWANPFGFGNCGALPSELSVAGFCASGNRVVMRTYSRLICIGDPGQKYNWQPSSQ